MKSRAMSVICASRDSRSWKSAKLRRGHVRVDRIIYIGKESNRLEESEAGLIHSPESVYTEYPNPRRDEWQTKILPILKNIPTAALMSVSGRSRSMLARTLPGRSRARRRNQELLKSMLHRLGVIWEFLVQRRSYKSCFVRTILLCVLSIFRSV